MTSITDTKGANKLCSCILNQFSDSQIDSQCRIKLQDSTPQPTGAYADIQDVIHHAKYFAELSAISPSEILSLATSLRTHASQFDGLTSLPDNVRATAIRL